MLELDHAFCFVDPDADWPSRLRENGWRLDDGIEHPGQGTRNRRLWMPEHYLELLWMSSRGDAETNPLRLDRRADWRTTGACPFGVALRGELTNRTAFWPYEPPYAPGATLWILRTEEAQPFVVVFDSTREQIERYLPRNRFAATPHVFAHTRAASIRELRLQLPTAAPALLRRVTPSIVTSFGPPRMEVVVGNVPGARLEITPEFTLCG